MSKVLLLAAAAVMACGLSNGVAHTVERLFKPVTAVLGDSAKDCRATGDCFAK